MIQAIYREREDGDWDFVAAIDVTDETGADWVQQITDRIEENEDRALVIAAPLGHLPEVLTPDGMTNTVYQTGATQ